MSSVIEFIEAAVTSHLTPVVATYPTFSCESGHERNFLWINGHTVYWLTLGDVTKKERNFFIYLRMHNSIIHVVRHTFTRDIDDLFDNKKPIILNGMDHTDVNKFMS